MGKKEQIQKELDFLLEKLRFWRYSILAIVSGVIGIIFGISQEKVKVNGFVLALLILGASGVIIAISRIHSITKEYWNLLEILKKEK